jgi:hypothetical protein
MGASDRQRPSPIDDLPRPIDPSRRLAAMRRAPAQRRPG